LGWVGGVEELRVSIEDATIKQSLELALTKELEDAREYALIIAM